MARGEESSERRMKDGRKIEILRNEFSVSVEYPFVILTVSIFIGETSTLTCKYANSTCP